MRMSFFMDLGRTCIGTLKNLWYQPCWPFWRSSLRFSRSLSPCAILWILVETGAVHPTFVKIELIVESGICWNIYGINKSCLYNYPQKKKKKKPRQFESSSSGNMPGFLWVTSPALSHGNSLVPSVSCGQDSSLLLWPLPQRALRVHNSLPVCPKAVSVPGGPSVGWNSLKGGAQAAPRSQC